MIYYIIFMTWIHDYDNMKTNTGKIQAETEAAMSCVCDAYCVAAEGSID